MSRFPNWRRACFVVASLMASPAFAESGHDSMNTSAINGAKIKQDIAVMKRNGMGAGAIKYVLSLDGIDVPDMVLSGQKSVDDAIADGTLRQGVAPNTWTPPVMQPAAPPDLTPKGSSASGWQPSTNVPTIDSMRNAVMGNTKPPSC